jgi:hypothetical protein
MLQLKLILLAYLALLPLVSLVCCISENNETTSDSDFINFLNVLKDYFSAINAVLFSLIPIGLAIILISILLLWIRTKEATYIQPFEIGECEAKYSGRAIADLLVSELQSIRLIHELKLPSVKAESKEGSILPSIAPGSESLEYNISNINISSGALTFSLGQILLILNRLFGRRETIIMGSLQKYGSTNHLVAWMGAKEAGRRNAWMAEKTTATFPNWSEIWLS